MPSLKDLRSRIKSVQSTRRITSAMKMVAAAKLRRAQDQAQAARPYAERMERMLSSLATSAKNSPSAPKLLAGTGKDQVHCLVVVSSDRGLCGGFNGQLVRFTRRRIKELTDQGRQVKLVLIGRKAVSLLKRDQKDKIVASYEELSKPAPHFGGADEVSRKLTEMFFAGEFDVCTLIYNKFVSALVQTVTPLQLIPFSAPEVAEKAGGPNLGGAVYDFEPDEEKILTALLPRNLSVQVYRALLESFASEQGARMTAMDNATRNAGDMIKKLNITYNRSRQAQITKELIEIISGAEAI